MARLKSGLNAEPDGFDQAMYQQPQK